MPASRFRPSMMTRSARRRAPRPTNCARRRQKAIAGPVRQDQARHAGRSLRHAGRVNAKGAGIFVCVNETDGKDREKTNITRVRAVFTDLDGAPIDPVIGETVLQPHIITETSPERKVVPNDTELADAYRLFAHGREAAAIVERELANLNGGSPIRVPTNPRVAATARHAPKPRENVGAAGP
jgi:hypothetical protein